MTDVTDLAAEALRLNGYGDFGFAGRLRIAGIVLDATREASIAPYVEALREARAALDTFGKQETLEQLYEDDEEWAKFRFLVKDYRRAGEAIAQIDALLPDTKGEG